MEAMLARYFDGDLDAGEVQAFLDAIESDPGLERELRAYEQTLAVGQALPGPRVPSGFTARVMADLPTATEGRGVLSWFPLPRGRWLAAAATAAAIVLAFFGGWWAGNGSTPLPTTDVPGAPTASVPVTADQSAVEGTGLRYVRLVYVPSDPSVQKVTVAGSFNNWEPGTTPMQHQNGAWSTILVLAPGSYEYMFVEDSNRWVTDPLAIETRPDGFGGANAVLDVES